MNPDRHLEQERRVVVLDGSRLASLKNWQALADVAARRGEQYSAADGVLLDGCARRRSPPPRVRARCLPPPWPAIRAVAIVTGGDASHSCARIVCTLGRATPARQPPRSSPKTKPSCGCRARQGPRAAAPLPRRGTGRPCGHDVRFHCHCGGAEGRGMGSASGVASPRLVRHQGAGNPDGDASRQRDVPLPAHHQETERDHPGRADLRAGSVSSPKGCRSGTGLTRREGRCTVRWSHRLPSPAED